MYRATSAIIEPLFLSASERREWRRLLNELLEIIWADDQLGAMKQNPDETENSSRVIDG